VALRSRRAAIDRSARRSFGLPLALIGTLVAAELAARLLRPHGAVQPASVPEAGYFTQGELQRARDFASGQRFLALGAIGVQGTVLGLLVAKPPRRAIRSAMRIARGREVAAGALLGAGLVVTLELAPLPLKALGRQRAIDVGLDTQEWPGWVSDLVKSTAIAALLLAAGATLFLSLIRRFPRRWWLGGAAAVVSVEVLFVWLAPVLLAPLFNRYTELREGGTRSDVIVLARKAGLDVGHVFVVDASKRTRATNAFVTGLGHTKRVVLYDNLLERFTPAHVKLVVAHELGHVKNRDLPRGMLWVALVAPAAVCAVKQLTDRLCTRAAVRPGTAESLPALAFAFALVSFALTTVSNRLSRRIEARADTFALELTNDPQQFIEMERRLTLSNLSDPAPPRGLSWLFGTHPRPIERIGAAVQFERERRP
jgi:STE24 endopeptidase